MSSINWRHTEHVRGCQSEPHIPGPLTTAVLLVGMMMATANALLAFVCFVRPISVVYEDAASGRPRA
jgi:hypothetical protein